MNNKIFKLTYIDKKDNDKVKTIQGYRLETGGFYDIDSKKYYSGGQVQYLFNVLKLTKEDNITLTKKIKKQNQK